MNPKMLIKGHTDVLLVTNMKRYIAPEDQSFFEGLRCTEEFAKVLKTTWPEAATKNNAFSLVEQTILYQADGTDNIYKEVPADLLELSSGFLEDISTPRYSLCKSNLDFSFDANKRDKLLLDRIFRHWSIYIRPTLAGFFIFQFTRTYHQKNCSVVELSHDISNLQSSLEINQSHFYNEAEGIKGGDGRILSLPIQSVIMAMVATRFIQEIGCKFISDSRSIRLNQPKLELFPSVQRPYIIYHFDELLVDSNTNKGESLEAGLKRTTSTNIEKIISSSWLKKDLKRLLENTNHRDETFDHSYSSNNNELCILTSKVAIIIELASQNQKNNKTNNNHLKSIGRIIEFGIEIQALASLVEAATFSLTENLLRSLQDVRSVLFTGEIGLGAQLPNLIGDANRMRFLYLFCKKFYRTKSWILTESLGQMANDLYQRLDIPRIIENIEHNVNYLDRITDSVDSFYATDLSEKNNDLAKFAMLLTASSLLLAFISLPSFWADIRQLFITFLPQFDVNTENTLTTFLNLFGIIGTIAIVIVLTFSIYLLNTVRMQFNKTRTNIKRIFS